MTRHAAFLRGINVGGHRKIPMSDLRELFTTLGLARVHTYIQSGNVVFDSAHDPADLEQLIARALRERCGFSVPVMVRSRTAMESVVARDPFAGRGLDPAKVAVVFLSTPVPADVALVVPDELPEEVVADGREVYVHYPDGQGRSRLERSGFFRPLAGLDATSRNWRTVTALLDMMS